MHAPQFFLSIHLQVDIYHMTLDNFLNRVKIMITYALNSISTGLLRIATM